MANVEIDWGSVSVHHGTFTVLLRGAWAHDATWAEAFNDGVPPVFSTSWGQIVNSASTLAAWGQIEARIDGTITVQALGPGHADQLRETLEKHVAAANAKLAFLVRSRQQAEPHETQAHAEQDARDQALMNEFRQPKP